MMIKAFPKMAFMGALLLGGAGTALAQEIEIIGLAGDWEISVTRDAAGAFEVCQGTLTYQNGESIILYTDGFGLTMGLLLERWQLDANTEYDIAIQFDENDRLPAKALAGDDRKSALVARDFSEQINDLAGARTMFLHTAAGSLRYALNGTREALLGLVDCAKQYNPSTSE